MFSLSQELFFWFNRHNRFPGSPLQQFSFMAPELTPDLNIAMAFLRYWNVMQLHKALA